VGTSGPPSSSFDLRNLQSTQSQPENHENHICWARMNPHDVVA